MACILSPSSFIVQESKAQRGEGLRAKQEPELDLNLKRLWELSEPLAFDALCPMVQVSSISTLWSPQEEPPADETVPYRCFSDAWLQLRAPSWERVLIQRDLGSVNSTCINLGDDVTPQASVSPSGKWAQHKPLHAVKLYGFDVLTCKKYRTQCPAEFLISPESPPGGRIPSWRKDGASPGGPGGPGPRTMQSIEFMPALV